MERVMYDVYIAEAIMENDYRNFDTPEKKEAYINRVFANHKITQTQWDSSLSWYSDRIDLYLKMNDSVKVRLQRGRQDLDVLIAAQNRANQNNPTLLPASYIPSFYSFSQPDARKGFRFRLDSIEIKAKVPGDKFLFSFRAIGIPPWSSLDLTATLMSVYSDTTIYQFQHIHENRKYDFPGSRYIPNDTITEVIGFVHYQNSIGIIPPVQLYDIYFKDIVPIDADSLKTPSDSLGKEPLALDSLIPSEPDSARLSKPEPIKKMQ